MSGFGLSKAVQSCHAFCGIHRPHQDNVQRPQQRYDDFNYHSVWFCTLTHRNSPDTASIQPDFCRRHYSRMSCPTSSVRRTQPWPIRATVALHGAPGLLIGFGVFLAGAALAAFLLAAIPTLMVSSCSELFSQLLSVWPCCAFQLRA